jgi:hypothetical protein
MNEHDTVDPVAVKLDSERLLLAAGAPICDWLPHVEHTSARSLEDIARRALIVNALIALAFKAPPLFIRDWLVDNGLVSDLAESEKFIVTSPEAPLPDSKLMQLSWQVECLWTLMWVCGRVQEHSFDDPIGDDLVAMLPDLEANESAKNFYGTLQRRSYAQMYAMRDLLYRANWAVRDGEINGYATPQLNAGVVIERRRALEWAMDATADWDHTDQST